MVPHQPLPAQAGVDFTAKRVAVVGTGATAVQAIPEIAQQAKQLTVFQRTANYCVPARNGKVDPELVKARKADYDGIVKRIRESFFGQEHYFIPKSALEATPEEREREFDRSGTPAASRSGWPTTRTCSSARRPTTSCADYLKRKIRTTVKDPDVAEKLIPKGYAYGTKRQPLDTNYYETFNKDNVLLVDAKTDGADRGDHRQGHPRRRQGVRVRHHRVRHRVRCADRAAEGAEPEGPRRAARWTRSGRRARTPTSASQVAGFPNLFTITGPQSPSVLSNMPVAIEQHVEWVTDCIDYMRKTGKTTIEATPRGAGPVGRARQRDRQHDADDRAPTPGT